MQVAYTEKHTKYKLKPQSNQESLGWAAAQCRPDTQALRFTGQQILYLGPGKKEKTLRECVQRMGMPHRLQGQSQLSSVGLTSVLTVHRAKRTQVSHVLQIDIGDSEDHSDASPQPNPLGLVTQWEATSLLARKAPACKMSLEHRAVTLSVGQSLQHGLFGHQLFIFIEW